MLDDAPDPDSEFNVVIPCYRTKYRVAGHVTSQDSFTIIAINESYTQRWAGTFSANFIDAMTQKAGCGKRISVFWRMLVAAANGESQTARIEIATEEEMQRRGAADASDSDGRVYILLTQRSEYDCFKYPLPLKVTRFTYEEYAQTIEMLYEDNRRLKRELAKSDGGARIEELEQKLGDSDRELENVRKKKDTQIAKLQKKVRRLKAKLAKTEQPKPVCVKL